MNVYRIYSKGGLDHGSRVAASPAEALLAQHHESGYGPDVVWLDENGELAFRDEEARRMLGGVSDWIIKDMSW